MSESSPIRHNLRSIHALRGFAAGAVTLAHSLEHGHYGGPIALFFGRFGVEVFFVISGIVITLAAGTSTFSPSSFLTRRFFRIAPLYWGTTLLVAGLAIVAPAVFRSTSFEAGYFIKSMLFYPDLVPGRDTDWRPLFKLGWTLNYEVFFYFAIALLFWCRNYTQRNALLIAIMTLFVAWSFFLEKQGSVLAFYANLNLLPFMSGVVIAHLLQRGTPVIAAMERIRMPLFIVMAAALVFAISFDFERFRDLDGHLAMTLAAILVALSALSLESRSRAEGGLLNWLGDISYSLYLLHMFFVGLVWAVLHRLHAEDIIWFSPLAAMTATVVLGCLAATISYRLFELPINRLGHKLGRKTTKTAQVHPA